MNKKNFIIKIIILYFFLISDAFAIKKNYFEEGKEFFSKKEFSFGVRAINWIKEETK